MANTSAICQQAAHTTYQLSSPSCSTRAIQKSLTLNEKYLRVIFLGKKSEEWTISRKWQASKCKRTRQQNKGGDRKGESNDSPEIPDKSIASDIAGLHSKGANVLKTTLLHTFISTAARRPFTVVMAALFGTGAGQQDVFQHWSFVHSCLLAMCLLCDMSL